MKLHDQVDSESIVISGEGANPRGVYNVASHVLEKIKTEGKCINQQTASVSALAVNAGFIATLFCDFQ